MKPRPGDEKDWDEDADNQKSAGKPHLRYMLGPAERKWYGDAFSFYYPQGFRNGAEPSATALFDQIAHDLKANTFRNDNPGSMRTLGFFYDPQREDDQLIRIWEQGGVHHAYFSDNPSRASVAIPCTSGGRVASTFLGCIALYETGSVQLATSTLLPAASDLQQRHEALERTLITYVQTIYLSKHLDNYNDLKVVYRRVADRYNRVTEPGGQHHPSPWQHVDVSDNLLAVATKAHKLIFSARKATVGVLDHSEVELKTYEEARDMAYEPLVLSDGRFNPSLALLTGLGPAPPIIATPADLKMVEQDAIGSTLRYKYNRFVWVYRVLFVVRTLDHAAREEVMKYGWAKIIAAVVRMAMQHHNPQHLLLQATSLTGVLFGNYEYGLFREKGWSRRLLRTVAHAAFTCFGALVENWWVRNVGARLSPLVGLAAATLVHTLWNIGVSLNASEALNEGQRPSTLPKMDITDVVLGASAPYPMRTADVCTADHRITLTVPRETFSYTPATNDECKAKLACIEELSIEPYVCTMFRACHHCVECAMRNRAGKDIPACHLPPAALEVAWLLPLNCTLTPVNPVRAPMPTEAWASGFEPKRRNELLVLDDEGITLHPDEYAASAFIKREKAAVDSEATPEGTSFKDPRLIQGCPLELSLAVGPWMRRAAKRFRNHFCPRQFDREDLVHGRHVYYTCGRTNVQIGRAIERAANNVAGMMDADDALVFLEDDQSRFDMHMLQPVFDYLLRFWSQFLPQHVLRHLVRGWRKGRTNVGHRYRILATMFSGWPDTSASDTAVNLSMKYHLHGVSRLWFSIVNGDDSVTVTTRKTLALMGGTEALIAGYARFGFEVTMLVRDSIWDVEFCSGRLMPVLYNGESTFCLFPKPGKFLAKIGWAEKDYGTKHCEWARSIASCLESFGRVDPSFLAPARALREKYGSGTEMRISSWEYSRVLATAQDELAPDHDGLLEYYARHYSVGHSDYLELCSLDWTAGRMKHPVLQHIAAKDA